MKCDTRNADSDAIAVILDGAEYAVVVGCVQESLTYIEEWEFSTLIGASTDEVRVLLTTLLTARDGASPGAPAASSRDGLLGSAGLADGVTVILSRDGVRQVTQCMNAVVHRLRSGALSLPVEVSAESAEGLLDDLLEAYESIEQS